jgi:predicted secreted protein
MCRILAAVICLALLMPCSVQAAIPNNTVILGGVAYDVSLLNDPSLAAEITAAYAASLSHFIYKTCAGSLLSDTREPFASSSLGTVTYVGPDKKPTRYAAGDGALVSTVVNTNVGSQFEIALDSNPTTGYSWRLQFDETYLTLADTRFQPSSPLIGAGGIETFVFTAGRVGDVEIRLEYKRVWEPGFASFIVYTVHIR